MRQAAFCAAVLRSRWRVRPVGRLKPFIAGQDGWTAGIVGVAAGGGVDLQVRLMTWPADRSTVWHGSPLVRSSSRRPCEHDGLPGRCTSYLPIKLTRQQLANMRARGSLMDDTYSFKPTTGPRPGEGFVSNVPKAPVPAPPETVQDDPEPDQQPAASNQSGRKQKAQVSTAADFTGPLAPCQLKIPTDLIQSLKLHSISSGKTMSELVFECITSPEMLGKAWISTRRAG